MILEIFLYTLSAIIALAGVILTILTLPGIWLVYIATVIVAFINGFETLTPTILIILFILSLLSTFVDNIVVAMGAKKFGGSTWGMIGAIVGGIVGLIVGSIVGMFLGPLIGATLFELTFSGKDINQSLKAGVGSAIGVLVSIFLKIGINIGIIVFVISKVL
jgi:hypothetical protein